jgi:hypothetical protein
MRRPNGICHLQPEVMGMMNAKRIRTTASICGCPHRIKPHTTKLRQVEGAPRCFSAFKRCRSQLIWRKAEVCVAGLEKIAECAETSGCELFCSDFRADKGVRNPIRVLRRRSEAACSSTPSLALVTASPRVGNAHELIPSNSIRAPLFRPGVHHTASLNAFASALFGKFRRRETLRY